MTRMRRGVTTRVLAALLKSFVLDQRVVADAASVVLSLQMAEWLGYFDVYV